MLYLHRISKSTACYLMWLFFSSVWTIEKSVLKNTIMFGLDEEACLARYEFEFEHQQIWFTNATYHNAIKLNLWEKIWLVYWSQFLSLPPYFPVRYLFDISSIYVDLLDRSPAFLISDDFMRSNEIIRTKWPIYVAIGHFVLMIW